MGSEQDQSFGNNLANPIIESSFPNDCNNLENLKPEGIIKESSESIHENNCVEIQSQDNLSPRSSNHRSVHTIVKAHISQTADQRPDEKVIKRQYKTQLTKQIEEQKKLKEQMLNLEKEQEEKMRREIEEDRQKMLHEEKLEAERRQKRVEAFKQREEETLRQIEAARVKAQEERKRRVEEKRHIYDDPKPKIHNNKKQTEEAAAEERPDWMNISVYSNPHDEQVIIPKTIDLEKLIEEESIKHEHEEFKVEDYIKPSELRQFSSGSKECKQLQQQQQLFRPVGRTTTKSLNRQLDIDESNYKSITMTSSQQKAQEVKDNSNSSSKANILHYLRQLKQILLEEEKRMRVTINKHYKEKQSRTDSSYLSATATEEEEDEEVVAGKVNKFGFTSSSAISTSCPSNSSESDYDD